MGAKESRRARWLAAFLTVTAITLAGCGADEEAGVQNTKSNRPSESAAAAERDPILIKTRVDLPTGKVVNGSTIGNSPFCPGGTFMDQHGTTEIGFVDRTITCRCLDGPACTKTSQRKRVAAGSPPSSRQRRRCPNGLGARGLAGFGPSLPSRPRDALLEQAQYTSRVTGCGTIHSGRSILVAPSASAAWRVLTSDRRPDRRSHWRR